MRFARLTALLVSLATPTAPATAASAANDAPRSSAAPAAAARVPTPASAAGAPRAAVQPPAAPAPPAPAATASRPPAPVYGGPPRPASLGATERQLAEAMRRTWPAAEIGVDAALSRAAADLALQVARGAALEAVARPESVRLALARAGAVAPEVQPMVLRASSRDAALGRLRERLARDASGPPPARVGVGAAETQDAAALVILRAPERVALEALPVQVQPGSSHRLAGRVLPPLQRATVYVTRPDGRPVRVESRGEGPRFEAQLPFPGRGRHTVEVLGDGPRGPEVAAILEVWAGEPIPAAAPAPPPAQQEPAGVEELEALAARLANELRAERGLRRLQVDPTLAQVARRFAEELLRTGRFAHRSPESGELGDRLRVAGYRYERAGENLAQAPDLRTAHESTVRSPGHLANLVEPAWTEAGFGVARGTRPDGGATVVLVQLFAVPASR